MDCPSETTAHAFVDKTLDAGARSTVLAHIDRCEDCRTLVSELVRHVRHVQETEHSVETRVGRYVLHDVLGCGAMGIVYAGRDPELHRDVAIKVMLTHGERDGRLLDEARAMAKIAHPNVVRVYDVGALDDRVFVTMELVDGCTLRTWASEPRSWRDVVDTWVLAGRGLAAAHAAGLVHGDFKPDNVLVDCDGQVRVTDFGLARGVADGAEPHGGTPVYMAPEQFRRAAVDHRTDQFGFCVSLYEALYGKRPFDGDSFAELAENVGAGRIVPAAPHADGRVPASLRRIVVRGLHADPSERYPSMDSLLRDLERARASATPRARWRRGLVVAAGILAVVAGTTALARVHALGNPVAGLRDARAPSEIARARVSEAAALTKLERWGDATQAAEDGRARFERLGDRSGVVAALRALASAQAGAGDLDGAALSLDRASGAAGAAGDRALLLETLDQSARVLSASGKLHAAIERDREVLRLAAELDNASIRLAALRRYAGNLTEIGRLAEAEPAWEEVKSLVRGDAQELARVTASTGLLSLERTDLDAAKDRYETALAAARSLHDTRCEALSLAGLAAVFEYEGDLRRARALYEEWMALAMRFDLGSFAKLSLATLAMEEGRFADAEGLVGAIGRGAESERKPTSAAVVAAADATLAWSLVEQGKIAAASEAIGRARLAVGASEVQRVRLHVATIGAVVDGFSGDPARVTAAFAALDAIDKEAADSDAARAALWARYARGRLELRLGRPEGRQTLDGLVRDAKKRKMETIARLATDHRTASR